MQFGALGQDLDYTVWGGTAPASLRCSRRDRLAIDIDCERREQWQVNWRALPYLSAPCRYPVGAARVGASTYNGKWANGNWYNSWGVDFNYFVGNLQTRGEWLSSYRQMPMGQAADNREGWYVQAGYFLLNRVKVPGLPNILNNYLGSIRATGALFRSQPTRASQPLISRLGTGVGQGGTQVGLVPDFGINGSPATYAPQAG